MKYTYILHTKFGAYIHTYIHTRLQQLFFGHYENHERLSGERILKLERSPVCHKKYVLYVCMYVCMCIIACRHLSQNE